MLVSTLLRWTPYASLMVGTSGTVAFQPILPSGRTSSSTTTAIFIDHARREGRPEPLRAGVGSTRPSGRRLTHGRFHRCGPARPAGTPVSAAALPARPGG